MHRPSTTLQNSGLVSVEPTSRTNPDRPRLCRETTIYTNIRTALGVARVSTPDQAVDCGCTMKSLILLTALLSATTVSATPSSLCADGKSLPLLVGKGDIYACARECPDGFACEKEDSDEVGVCCPNLQHLSELYGGEHNESAKVDFQKSAQQKSGGEKDEKEIRRAPGRAQRVLLNHEPSHDVIAPPSALPLPIPPPNPGVLCERQKFKTTCEVKGFVKATQFVVRWYVQNGKCHSYPYGFCPGTRVENDFTLRTKDDCELLCLTPAEFRHSDLFDFLATADGAVTQQPEFESLDELPGNDLGVDLEVKTEVIPSNDAEQVLQTKNPP
uniref:BPTI/Kunitz inhibitor domain-containing protein n=1 Tax=Bursaphelenchus xylophilus TaxID=6326 RepID=A0A1I7SA01_BURXY